MVDKRPRCPRPPPLLGDGFFTSTWITSFTPLSNHLSSLSKHTKRESKERLQSLVLMTWPSCEPWICWVAVWFHWCIGLCTPNYIGLPYTRLLFLVWGARSLGEYPNVVMCCWVWRTENFKFPSNYLKCSRKALQCFYVKVQFFVFSIRWKHKSKTK